jgi:hypothetical protein
LKRCRPLQEVEDHPVKYKGGHHWRCQFSIPINDIPSLVVLGI